MRVGRTFLRVLERDTEVHGDELLGQREERRGHEHPDVHSACGEHRGGDYQPGQTVSWHQAIRVGTRHAQ